MILEREAEFVALDALLASARSGRGGVAVVEGEPGVGKSTLLGAACRRAQVSGLRVLGARSSELEATSAFGVARQLFDGTGASPALPRSLPVVDDPQDGGYAQIQRLFDVTVELANGTERAGLVVAIDDAQWADEQSLRFIAHLALRIDPLPIALLVAVRQGDGAARSLLLETLGETVGASVVTLTTLSPGAVVQLVRAALGEDVDTTMVEACALASGGNPFYLRELLSAIGAEPGVTSAEQVAKLVPRRVLRSVMVRLGRLGRDAAALARALVVLGDGAELRMTAQLAELEPVTAEVAADRLAAARILSKGEPLSFTHPMIASAVGSDMGHFAQRRAHRRAAELLLVADSPTVTIAAHVLRAPAGHDPRFAAALEDAAAQSLASGAPKDAARFLIRALEEGPDEPSRSRIMLAAAMAEAHAGSATAIERLEAAVSALGPGEPRANGLAELATALHHRGQFGRAVELARRGRAELQADHPNQERLMAIEVGAALLDPAERLSVPSVVEPLVALAKAGRPPTDPRLLAVLTGWMGVSEPSARVRMLAEAAFASDPLIDGSLGGSVGWVASALIWIDELTLAERWLDAVLIKSAERGVVMASAVAQLNRATVRHHAGNLDGAINDAERALDVYRYGWTSSPWSTPVLIATHVVRGDLGAAHAALAVGERAGAEAFDFDLLLEARCRLRLAAGEAGLALADALAVGQRVESRSGTEQPRLWAWRRLAATAAHRLGRAEEAQELIERDLSKLREIGPARQLGEALTVAGTVTGGATGLELLSEAVATLGSSSAQLQRMQSLVELGSALRRAGHRNDAKAPLYEALDLADRAGAQPVAQRARDELAVLGARPRRAARFGPMSLTSAERRVVELAAAGQSTPQIASELYVTTKTVESHLSRAYRKLGVTRRADLAAALASQ